ncbi:MAG: hypothetical protein M3T56_17645, partial [Chloroflexota bacterium]|nr:hypothetical protein [Chloroflexota bacterium]
MAVGAADVALFDLGLDASPRTSGARISRYVRDLVAAVIEFEHDDVALAAVHTVVGCEVLDDAATILGASHRNVPQQPVLLDLAMLSVVLASVRGEALAAPGLKLRLATA